MRPCAPSSARVCRHLLALARFWRAVWRLGGHRGDEDLHTVSIPSASLLHIRELRCRGIRTKARRGESVAWFSCGMPARSF
jgi:hypothetical protein